MLKIYNTENLIAERKARIKTVSAPLFAGTMFANKQDQSGPVQVYNSAKQASEIVTEMEEIRHSVVSNAAQAPSSAVVDAFFGKFFIDVTRRAMEAPDVTSLIAQEATNFEFPETVNLRDLIPFRGKMGVVSGANDGVNLIEQNTGNVETVTMGIKAVGWKDSIKNLLFNKFFTMDKVVQAAVDADTDARNAATVGLIVAATYVASQQQAAIATAGLTYDEKMYETLLAAWKKLVALKDPKTSRKIAAPRVAILCNSADSWSIQNVMAGQLNGNGSSARTNNRPGLPIGTLIEYDHGINDGFTIGKEIVSFPGVTAGKAYIFVPGVMIVANKRPLTMETGRGSVLELSTEERAWYRIQGEYSKDFLGSSYPGTALGASFGYIIEVTLPT